MDVGEPFHGTGDDNEIGHVQIYRWKSASWVRMGQEIDGASESRRFGSSLLLFDDGTNLIIGKECVGADPGSTRVFC